MTERMLIRIERRYPDVLTAESEVKGITYLFEASPSQIVVAPSGKALAYIGQEPVLRLTAKQAVEMAHELLALLEVEP